MTILITGVAGFIGSSFAHWLIENTEHKVVGIDNLSGGYADNMPDLSERFQFRRFSINDATLLNVNLEYYKPSVVFHMAAYASEGRANHIRNFIHSNNTVGSANVINACVNVGCKLVFTSSVAVYSGEPPFTENTIPNPIDTYGNSKYCTELDIKAAGETQGLDWCIIRPRNAYGIRQSLFDRTRNLFGIWCYNALNGLPLVIFGDGNNKRSFTYIDDILSPLHNSIRCNKQVINLGSEKVYTIKQAQEIFSEVTGYANVIHTEPRHEVAEAFCLTEKSKHLLEYEEKTSLHEGLDKMWQWAKLQPKRNLQVPPQLEVTKNAHSSLK